MTLRIEPLTGAAVADRLDDLARLRIEVFHDFPYLYDGDPAYERRYLAHLAASPGAVIVGAFDGDVLVGAATGAPLADQDAAITEPFRARGEDLSQYFYFGESVLQRGYRGRGIGVRFFEAREAQARRLGFPIATFCAVVRPDDHPQRPAGHVPLDAFWRKRGYAPLETHFCLISWKEIGEGAETPKRMRFWSRRLSA